MSDQRKIIFVTGGTGLVGGHLIYKLLSEGSRVRAIHRRTSNREILKKIFGYYSDKHDALYREIEWIESDIMDFDRLAEAMNGARVVYHCAAAVSFETAQKESVLRNNVLGTTNIVKACLENRVEKLCHVSSVAALGASDMDIMVNETKKWDDEVYHPVYGTSKHLSEEEVWKGIEMGLNAVIVNPSIILGPGEWGRGSASLFSNIDRGMLFYTNGVTGYVDVNDVVKAMIILTESGISGERFIVSSENLTYRQILTMIAESLGARKPIFMVPKIFSYPVYAMIPVLNLVIGKKSPLTREILKAAWSEVTFDNSKIIKSTGISFLPVKESVKATGSFYISDKTGKN